MQRGGGGGGGGGEEEEKTSVRTRKEKVVQRALLRTHLDKIRILIHNVRLAARNLLAIRRRRHVFRDSDSERVQRKAGGSDVLDERRREGAAFTRFAVSSRAAGSGGEHDHEPRGRLFLLHSPAGCDRPAFQEIEMVQVFTAAVEKGYHEVRAFIVKLMQEFW